MVGTVAASPSWCSWFGRLWAQRLGVPSALFPQQHWAFLLPTLVIAASSGALALRYFYVAHEWRAQRRARGPLAHQGAAGPHSTALSVQQHEHDRGTYALRSGAAEEAIRTLPTSSG